MTLQGRLMKEKYAHNNNEIDLFELLETLWDCKILITCFVSFALAIGFGYTLTAQKKYKVSVTYTTNLYSIGSQQNCFANSTCLDIEAARKILRYIDKNWNVSSVNQSVSLTSSTPLSSSEYIEAFQIANDKITENILTEAKAELHLIETELNDALLGTERVATNILNAKRVITAIGRGESAVDFGEPSINRIAPKSNLIIVLSALLGGITGLVFVISRKAIHYRREIKQIQS